MVSRSELSATAGALLLGTLAAASPAHAETQTFDIQARQGWQTVGHVDAGQQYTIWQEEGLASADDRNGRLPRVDGAGYSKGVDSTIFQGCKLDQNLQYGLTIAQVNDENLIVGTGTIIKPRQSGELKMRIHDGDACLGDNSNTSLRYKMEKGGSVDTLLAHMTSAWVRRIQEPDRQQLQYAFPNLNACDIPSNPACGPLVTTVFSMGFRPPSGSFAK